jgi:hypothetical protein
MPDVQGRVLEEALRGGPPISEYAVVNKTHLSSIQGGLTVKLPTDLERSSMCIKDAQRHGPDRPLRRSLLDEQASRAQRGLTAL